MTLVEALTSAGFNVQLMHDPTETTWESHGWVSIRDGSGKELVRNEDCQHNRNYSTRVQTMKSLAEEAMAAMQAQAAEGSPRPVMRTTSEETAAAV